MRMVPINDLSRIEDDDRAQILGAIERVMGAGTFFKGEETAKFEALLSEMMSGRPCVTVANGTDALYLAMRALDIGPGKRVATVANAGGYTSGAALRLGAAIVLVDVDSRTAQMSLEALAEICSKYAVDAVVVTHLYGLVGEIQGIADFCRDRCIPVIEDCAQSLGAYVGECPAGTFGDLATFSFYPTKNLGGFGDGGAVACRTKELRDRIAELAQYGWTSRYLISSPLGINSRLDEIQAAVLNSRARHLKEDALVRCSIIRAYEQALQGSRRMICNSGPNFVGHLAVMVTETRHADMQALEKAGIVTGVHYPFPDHKQPAWEDKVSYLTLANTELLSNQVLTLPCFPTMSVEEISKALGAIASLR